MRRRIAVLVPLTALLAGLTAGCGDESPPEPAGDRVSAELVTFEPTTAARNRLVAIGDAPIDPVVVAGWKAVEDPGLELPEDRDEVEQVPDKPGRSYVLVAATTGCMVADGAELWRDGDDLRVRFTGRPGPEECAAPYNALAQFEVEPDRIEGVRTVLGLPPLPGAGPAKLTGFVKLGSAARMSIKPVQLRGDTAKTLYAALQHARVPNLAEARAVLDRPPAADHRAYAYVLSGCAETGAQLIVRSKVLVAELTGGERINCVAAVHFLATFEIPAKQVPIAARPR